MNRDIVRVQKKREQKAANQLKAIFRLSNSLNRTFYPCSKGGAHDTKHYLGVEPMYGNKFRKHYRCTKCGQNYSRTY